MVAAVAVAAVKPAHPGTGGNEAIGAYGLSGAGDRCPQLNVARVGGADPSPGSRPNRGSPGFSLSRKNHPAGPVGVVVPMASVSDGCENPA